MEDILFFMVQDDDFGYVGQTRKKSFANKTDFLRNRHVCFGKMVSMIDLLSRWPIVSCNAFVAALKKILVFGRILE